MPTRDQHTPEAVVRKGLRALKIVYAGYSGYRRDGAPLTGPNQTFCSGRQGCATARRGSLESALFPCPN